MRRLWLAAGIGAGLLTAGVIAAFGYSAATTPSALKLADAPSPAASSPSPTPPRPALENTCVAPPGAATTTLWIMQSGSKAGFRAHEKFLEVNLPHVAVARSEAVGGYLVSTSDRRHLQEGCVAVDLRALTSIDKLPPPLPPATNRDGLFPDIFDLADYPLAVFTIEPMDLPPSRSGLVVHLVITGQIKIRDVTKPVSVKSDCRLTAETLACAGSTVVDARQFNLLLPPQESPIQVNPMITIEFSLVFTGKM